MKRSNQTLATIKTVLVTGGLGFIGGHFIEMILEKGYKVINIDKITYASRPELNDMFMKEYPDRYSFMKIDICDLEELPYCDYIVHFGAESHVDNSLKDSSPFIKSNIFGTYNLLRLLVKTKGENLLHLWQGVTPLFIYISTDEVFGDIEEGFFKENDRFNPSNPYSASKASAELLVKSWGRSYGINYIITRTTNNYGERQHPEKLIPMAISKALLGERIRIHGSRSYIRNWIYVKDNCEAVYLVMTKGEVNQEYHISSNEECSVVEIARMILDTLGKPLDDSTVEYVPNRAGQDVRYALDCSKIKRLGWKQRHSISETLSRVVKND